MREGKAEGRERGRKERKIELMIGGKKERKERKTG